ncbi:uncharacterized protein [Antedon mediterranea]|uniref:uncharacterized protein n=1 Tax=Antedon mediterranea TaxID=105859 RepID=UPI003AF452A9
MLQKCSVTEFEHVNLDKINPWKMSAERSLLTLDYVHLKGKQYSREHGKRFCKRTLGDMEKFHQIVPPKSSNKLFSTMMSLEFDETRAVNDLTAKRIIKNQRAQIKNTFSSKLRSCQLEEWRSMPDKQNQKNKKRASTMNMNTNARPGTAGPMNTANIAMVPSIAVRPFSTGPRIRSPKKQVKNEYVRVPNKEMGSFRDIDIRKVANELRQSWAKEDKSEDVKTPQKHIKSAELSRYDMSGQWLSFAGGGSEESGVVDAFLGKDVDEYYNIEGQIGNLVANQVTKGNKVHVCINGELQSENMRIKARKGEESKGKPSSQDSEAEVANKAPPSVIKKTEASSRVPLSWEDQITCSSVKILEPTVLQPTTFKKDMTERYPVIFKKLTTEEKPRPDLMKPSSYRVRSRTKNRKNVNGIESLNNRITVITVDQGNDDDVDSLASEDYQEILQRRLEASEKPQDEKKELEKETCNAQSELKEKCSKEVFQSKSSTSHCSIDRTSKETLVSITEKPLPPAASSTSSSLINLVAQGSNPKLQTRPPSSSVISSKRVGSSKSNSVQEERQSHSASQRPQLSKPDQLPCSGSAMRDRGKEFVSISQQIRLPTGVLLKKQRSSPELKISSPEIHHDFSGDELDDVSIGQLSHVNSMGSLDSLIAANGNNDQSDHDHHNCTCTVEAKMAVSAVLSSTPHQTVPSTIINVNLPTVQMSVSDSMSDLYLCTSGVSFQDHSHHQIMEKLNNEMNKSEEHVASSKQLTDETNGSEVDMIINQVDGLSISPEAFQSQQETQTFAKRPRSVKFQDEVIVNTPNVPTNSPRAEEEVSNFSSRS